MDPTLEQRLDEIDEALACLSNRVRVLESTLRPNPTEELPPAFVPVPLRSRTLAANPVDRVDLVAALTLLGRTLIVVGGAFLLRALTDAGRLSGRGGLLLGLGYAGAWLVAADHARRPSGLFHGLAALIIGMPLLWEASTRFRAFSPATVAGGLLLLSGSALAVAWHKRLIGVATAASLGSIGTAAALMMATARPLPFAIALLAIGTGTLWVGYQRQWRWLYWPGALSVDLIAVGLIGRASVQPPLEPPWLVVTLGLFLLAAYLGSFVLRSLMQEQRLLGFEWFQSVAVMAIGIGGSLIIRRSAGEGVAGIIALSALLSGGAYFIAFRCVGRRGLRWNLVFFATVGLILAITAIDVGAIGLLRTLIFAAVAMVATWLGRKLFYPILWLHGAAYAVAAALGADLTAKTGAAWLGAVPDWRSWLDASPWIVLAMTFANITVLGRQKDPPALLAVSRLAMMTVALILLGSAVVSTLALSHHAGVVASIRTCVLASAAVALALIARASLLAEVRWLTYAVLVGGAAKFAFEDVRFSEPATLFVAFGFYGAALVAAPRLLRRRDVTERRTISTS